MLEDHSLGLLTATVISIIVYIAGLAVNLSDFARQYISIPLIPSILRENTSNATRPQILPISLADWSIPLWGVVYVLQLFWLAYAVVGICRKTAAGPAYNNPKLLPVQVHLFFTLGVLMQIGWLVSMDRNNLGFALFLSLPATGFFITCVGESYRALAGTQALLLQQDRIADLWAVRILAQNGLALLMSWMTLHMTLTFALFLAYGMASYAVDRDTASLVGVSLSTSLVVIYVLCDILLLDRYARLIVSPYLAAVVFTAAQINKDWPDTHTAVFGVLAALTTFSFLAVLLKATVLLWRQLPPRNSETKGMATRPLPSELEEEAYLLEATK